MPYEHLNDTNPKARKNYRCVLCGLVIAKGELHVARRGVFDGEAFTQRMHTDCETVTQDWLAEDWENRSDELEFRQEKDRFFTNRKDRIT